MVDKVDEYDPTKKSGRLRPQSKTTLKQRMAKATEYSDLDPKLRRKIKENNLREKYNSLSDTQKKSLQGIKTAAEVASLFLPGGALRLAIPVVRGIQAAKTGFKVGKNTYKTLKEATAAKNKLKKVIPSKIKTKNPQTGKQKATPDTKKTTEATKQLKSQTTRNLKAQQKALKARQDKTTKNLKSASNVALTGGALIAASNARSKKEKLSPGALGGKVKSSPSIKRKARTDQERRLAKFASENKAATNRKPNLKKKVDNKALGYPKIEVKNKPTPQLVDKSKLNSRPTSYKVKKGPARSVKEAQTRKLSTFTNKAGKKLAAVTKEQLDKSGLSLRDYLNKKEGLTRKKPTTKKMGGGKVYRRGGGRALRGMGKAIYSNKMY